MNLNNKSSVVKKLEKESRRMFDKLTLYFANERDDFWLHNRYPPGLGKSRYTIDLIAKSNLDFDIVIPNHAMLYGKNGMVDNCRRHGISYQNALGKRQYVAKNYNPTLKIADDLHYRVVSEDEVKKGVNCEKLCMRDDGNEYFPSCKGCENSELCLYKKFGDNMQNKRVIFTPIQSLKKFENRFIIFDESIEQLMKAELTNTRENLEELGVILEKEEIQSISGRDITYFNNISIAEENYINFKKEEDPKNEGEYFLWLYLKSVLQGKEPIFISESDGSNPRYQWKGVQARINNKNKKIILFGKLINFMPLHFKGIIYNCATISQELLEKTMNFNSDENPTIFNDYNNIEYHDWKEIKSKIFEIDNLDNPILQFKGNWGQNSYNTFFDYIIKMFSRFYEEKKSLLITKKELKKDFKKYFNRFDIKMAHYSSARGYNTLEIKDEDNQYDLVLLYGRFGFDPFIRDVWKRIGYSDELIDQMEMNEILQALHRCRALLHPKIPIMLMCDKNLLKKMDIIKMHIDNLKLLIDHGELNNAITKEKFELFKKNLNLLEKKRPTIFYRDYIKLITFIEYKKIINIPVKIPRKKINSSNKNIKRKRIKDKQIKKDSKQILKNNFTVLN